MFTQLQQCAQDHTVMGGSSDPGSEFRSLSTLLPLLPVESAFSFHKDSKQQVKQVVCKIQMFYETMCYSTLRTFLLIMLEQTLKAHILAHTYNPTPGKPQPEDHPTPPGLMMDLYSQSETPSQTHTIQNPEVEAGRL